MSTPVTLRDKRRDAERRDSLVSAAVASSRPTPIRPTPPAVTHLEQGAVTMRLLAVIEAGFGRSIAWDEAIAATLRAIGWTEDQVAGLFLAAETAP
jgi:hypothetical protein